MKQREGTISRSEMTDGLGPPQLLLQLVAAAAAVSFALLLKQSPNGIYRYIWAYVCSLAASGI